MQHPDTLKTFVEYHVQTLLAEASHDRLIRAARTGAPQPHSRSDLSPATVRLWRHLTQRGRQLRVSLGG